MRLKMSDNENVMTLSNDELATVIVGLKQVIKLTGDELAILMVAKFSQVMKGMKNEG